MIDLILPGIWVAIAYATGYFQGGMLARKYLKEVRRLEDERFTLKNKLWEATHSGPIR